MKNRIFYGKNNTNVTLNFGPQSGTVDWIAFQGFIYALNNSNFNSNCLLTGETFNLTDNTQTIPLFAFGNRSTEEIENCTWTFIVPSNHTLKVVITSLNLYGLETLNITGSSNIGVESIGKYTSEGEQVRIIYSKNHTSASFLMEYGFQGYVTLVKLANPESVSCINNQGDNSVVYSNFGNNGYSNDKVRRIFKIYFIILLQTCEQEIIANVNDTYILDFTKNYYERFSDILQVKDSKNISHPLDYELLYYYERSSSEKNDSLMFTSDGSIVQGGFEIRQRAKSDYFSIK